jgi:Microtubule-associated tyrosine carboxypeptidase
VHRSPPNLTGSTLAAAVIDQLSQDKRVRQELPGGGRVHFDRRVPFVCVYRRRPAEEDAGTEQLISSETAYLLVPAEARPANGAVNLLRSIVKYLAEHFGGCLIVEVWTMFDRGDDQGEAEANGEPAAVAPRFRITTSLQRIPRTTVESLSKSLAQITLARRGASVDIARQDGVCPPGLKPLLKDAELHEWNCFVVGLAVKPVYRDRQTKELYPSVMRSVRRGVNGALKQAFFTFAHQRTKARPSHFYALGRRSVVKTVFDVDRELAQIDRSFDLLLQATPVNAETAWRDFRRARFDHPPVFYYRPLVIDPTLLKRRLYAIPVEKIEDPTLSYLFRQKQEELDRQITLLSDIDSPRFLPESLQIYGGVSNTLLEEAKTLLDRVPTRSGEESLRGQLSAAEFARRAEKELQF